MKTNKSPEILAPAGDLSTALRAYEAGAHAVYLGLKDFSARKGAVNFDFSELRRLKAYSKQNAKAFYVTLNTLIKEDEFEAMHSTLRELELIGPSALIVQDWGLVRFIKKYFPSLVLHASTQMAIHNGFGLQMAKELGIERVVLSRELSFDQIKTLREEHPDIELEVFIHGALCYSFSGLCLASGLLLERSGNRGLCAQLCRNFYRSEGQERYPFSCNDLALHEEVIKLAEIGIDSFKIEGRLKSKEYVQSTVRLYSSLLKNDRSKAEIHKRETALSFARKQSSAYFNQSSGKDLLDPLFPGHRGIKLGQIEKIKGPVFSLTPLEEVQKNDTLLLLNSEGKFARFTAFNLKKEKDQVHITFEDKEGSGFYPQLEDEVYLIHSASQQKVAEVDYKTVSEEKCSLPLTLILKEKILKMEGALPTREKIIWEAPCDLQEAKGDKDFSLVLKDLFKEAQSSRFCFDQVEIVNETGIQKIFAPLSQLKKIKNSLYEKTEELFNRETQTKWNDINQAKVPAFYHSSFKDLAPFKKRLSFAQHDHIPFAHLKDLGSVSSFKTFEGHRVIPLLPVLPNEKAYFEALEKLIENFPQEKFLIGLNNLGHVAWAKSQTNKEQLRFFADFYIYNANSSTLEFIKELLPDLAFAYKWVEGPVSFPSSPFPLIKAEDSAELPYFISLGCFEKHNVLGGKCPNHCGKRYSHVLKNGPNNYQVLVRDCITYMRRKEN